MAKRLLPIILIAALAAGVLWWTTRDEEDPNRIRLSGNIEWKLYEISFKTAGRLVELKADEGDVVKKGDLVARIDTDQLLQSRDRELAGVRVSESALAQTRTAVAYQDEATESEILLRRAELAQVKARLEEALAGSRPQEVQHAAAVVADMKSRYQQASEDWQRARTLFQNDDISVQQRDQFRARFESAEAALRQAEQQQALVKEGPRSEEIDAAKALVARAEAAVRMAEAQRLSVRQTRQEVDSRRADIERARRAVGVLNAQLEDARVFAPVDGVVMVRSAETGEVVAAGTSVLTIGDVERPWLRGYINETQLGRVKIGQKVRVTTDSFPGKEYWGRVSFIASEAEFTPKQIQTHEERVKLVYRIKVDIANPERELKNNMPVDAEILLES